MSTKSQSDRKIVHILALSAANGLVYGFNALYYCFLQIYLEMYHTPVSVGILLSVGPLVAIAAPLFWGVKADKAKYKNNILSVTVIGSAVFFFLLMINQNFWYLFAILFVVMFFMSPFASLIDTITLEYAAQNNIAYGPMRLTGTFVFGLIPLVLTAYTEVNINIIFYAYLVIAVLCLISIYFMPKVPGYARDKTKVSVKPVLTDKRLMLMIFIVFVSQTAWAYYNNFFPTYITGTLGLPQTVWGANVFITVLGEVPFFLLFNRIFSRFGIRKLLFVGIVLSVIRYLGLAVFTNAPLILFTGLLTGFSITVLTYCVSFYIINNMQPEVKASAQTIMYAVASGIPRVLAGVFGGVMTNSFGVKTTMFIMTGLCVTMFGMYLMYLKQDQTQKHAD
jgi:Nucleoside H+ symporter.